jgi:hypothetical protein
MRAQDRVRQPSAKLFVYDGRTLIGLLRERGKRVEAIAITGNKRPRLGVFRSRRAAMRAIPSANDLPK